MPTISISGQTIEVYQDLAQANAYFATVINGATWSAASSGDRNRALVTATNVFDRTSWQGDPTEPIDKDQPPAALTQPIAWPRTGLVDRDGVSLDETEVPRDIEYGNLEYALALIEDAAILDKPTSGSNLKSDLLTEKVDVIQVTTRKEWFTPTANKATKFPTNVFDYVGFWLDSTTGGLAVFAGGTDVCSDANVDWGTLSRGWP
jgi:hypothetical protein